MKLYEKNELNFSLVWIGIYLCAMMIGDNLSSAVGIEKITTAPLCIILTAVILVMLIKNGLTGKYGLDKVKLEPEKYLYFIPLIIIGSVNLWRGVTLNLSIAESLLYVISMICVGFIEEMIFRGFLFKALCRDNVKTAVIISSLTFGAGHISNLLNGEELFSTVCQICYAAAIGLLFTVIFLRSGSLIPCIITHSAINSLSAFGVDGGNTYLIIVSIILTAVSVVSSVIILKNTASETVAASGVNTL